MIQCAEERVPNISTIPNPDPINKESIHNKTRYEIVFEPCGIPTLVTGFVSRNLSRVTLLVLQGLLVVLGPLAVGELLVLNREKLGDVTKLGLGVLGLDPVPVGVREVEEGAHGALGRVGVLLLLLLAALAIVGVGVLRGNVVLHLLEVADLVLLSGLLPPGKFPGGKLLELVGEELGDVTELGFGVVRLDSVSVGVGEVEEGAHAALGGIGVLLLLAALAVVVVGGVLLGWNIVLHLVLVTKLVLLGELVPLLGLPVRETFELGRKETGNVTEFGFGVVGLDPRAVCVRVEEESAHAALGLEGVLLLLLGLAPLLDRCHHLLLVTLPGHAFFVATHFVDLCNLWQLFVYTTRCERPN